MTSPGDASSRGQSARDAHQQLGANANAAAGSGMQQKYSIQRSASFYSALIRSLSLWLKLHSEIKLVFNCNENQPHIVAFSCLDKHNTAVIHSLHVLLWSLDPPLFFFFIWSNLRSKVIVEPRDSKSHHCLQVIIIVLTT